MGLRDMKKRTLQQKIFILSLVLSACVTSALSAFYSYNRYTDLESSLNNYMDALSFQMSQYFNERMQSVATRVYSLTRSERFQETFWEYLNSDLPYQYYLTLTNYNTLVSDIRIPDSFVSSMCLYTPKGMFYDLSTLSPPQLDFLQSKLYAEYAQAGSPPIYFGHQNEEGLLGTGKGMVIVINVPISGYAGNSFLLISLNHAAINNYLTLSTLEGGYVVILKGNQEIITSSNTAMTARYHEWFTIEEEGVRPLTDRYMISARKLNIQDWYVVVMTGRESFGEVLRNRFGQDFLLLLLSVSVAFFCAMFFSKRIIRPIRDLQEYMTRFTAGDYSLYYDYQDENEVGRLAQCFNEMVTRIGSLMGELNATIKQLQVEKDNVRQEQCLKRTAELNALQAQINPHFLYNTLNSIVWLAAENESEKISLLADNLSRFYEYRIRGRQLLAPIRDEIEQIKSYVEIQNIRYGNHVRCSFQVEEALLDKAVIKLAIQPLVENAMLHGLQYKRGDGNILVRIARSAEGGNILIEVEDEGIGIAPRQLEYINRSLETCQHMGSSYGISNVNERIKLYFGSQYGLCYQSEPGSGTRAIICIPMMDYTAPEEGGNEACIP